MRRDIIIRICEILHPWKIRMCLWVPPYLYTPKLGPQKPSIHRHRRREGASYNSSWVREFGCSGCLGRLSWPWYFACSKIVSKCEYLLLFYSYLLVCPCTRVPVARYLVLHKQLRSIHFRNTPQRMQILPLQRPLIMQPFGISVEHHLPLTIH